MSSLSLGIWLSLRPNCSARMQRLSPGSQTAVTAWIDVNKETAKRRIMRMLLFFIARLNDLGLKDFWNRL